MALKLSKKTSKVQKVVKKAPVARVVSGSKKVSTAQLSLPTGVYTEAVGRRKVATARVRLYESKGDYVVNDRIVGNYFSTVKNADRRYLEPFKITGTEQKFSIVAHISGSGVSSQLDAMVHGIARALVKFNPEFRPLLKAAGMLTRDDRMKETRKIGMGGSARRSRQSPKR